MGGVFSDGWHNPKFPQVKNIRVGKDLAQGEFQVCSDPDQRGVKHEAKFGRTTPPKPNRVRSLSYSPNLYEIKTETPRSEHHEEGKETVRTF